MSAVLRLNVLFFVLRKWEGASVLFWVCFWVNFTNLFTRNELDFFIKIYYLDVEVQQITQLQLSASVK